MVERTGPEQEQDRRTNGLSKVKQETSVIQALSAASRELSDRQHEDILEEESARRAGERLARRPSYNKIFTDLGGHQNMISEEKEPVSEGESGGSSEDHSERHQLQHHHQYSHHPGLRVLPSNTLISNGGNVTNMESLHGVMSTANNGSIVQYTTNTDTGGPFFVPSMSTIGSSGLGSPQDDSSRKREIRLLKNREAARECRRKKKEYIKCLENRVAVLENQNKALIEELKSLKELYTTGGNKMM